MTSEAEKGVEERQSFVGSPTPSGLDLDTQDWSQEPDISPMSKKILENCTASATVTNPESPIKATKSFSASAAKDITSSLLHRPASSGFAPSTAGFQFARPPPPPKAGSAARFSLRPGAKPLPPAATPIASQASGKDAEPSRNSPVQDTPTHGRVDNPFLTRAADTCHNGASKTTETHEAQNEAAPTNTLPSPKNTLARPVSNHDAPDVSQNKPSSPPPEQHEEETSSTIISPQKDSNISCAETNATTPMDSSNKSTPEHTEKPADVSSMPRFGGTERRNNPPSRPMTKGSGVDFARRFSPSLMKSSGPARNAVQKPLPPRVSGSSAARIAATMPSRVCKKPQAPRMVSNGVTSVPQTQSQNSSVPKQQQPSEEDLFFMLINRMKRRDEAELASRTLQERLQRELSRVTQVNDRLQSELDDAEKRDTKQSQDLQAARGLIETWKAKFEKIKGLLDGLGADLKNLHSENQQAKASQASCSKELAQLHSEIKRLVADNTNLSSRCHSHKTELSNFEHIIGDLQHSVLLAKSIADERDRTIREDRCRIAKMENHIRSQTSRQLSQGQLVHGMQEQALDRLHDLCRNLETWKASSENQAEDTRDGLNGAMTLLRSLNEREMLESTDLESVKDAIKQVASQIDRTASTSKTAIEEGLKAQHGHNDTLAAKLETVDSLLASTVKNAEKTATVHEMNGTLKSKLESVELSLSEVTKARDELQETQTQSRKEIERLEVEVGVLREARRHHESETTSKLNNQLETLSATLSEASHELEEKNKVISQLQETLSSKSHENDTMKENLQSLEMERTELKNENARVELNVRQEMMRANMVAKEQNKATLEQERHQMGREKMVVEQALEKVKGELDTTKKSLQQANSLQKSQSTKANDYDRKIDDLKKAAAKANSEYQTKVSEFEQKLASSVKQLNGAQEETKELRRRLSELQADDSTRKANDHRLEMEVERLRSQIVEKENRISSGEQILQTEKEQHADALAKIQQESSDRGMEIESLQRKLENATLDYSSMALSLQGKEDEVVDLHQKLQDLAKERSADDEKEWKLLDMKSELGKTKEWFNQADSFMRGIGILGGQESLMDNWEAMQTRFKSIIEQVRKSERSARPEAQVKRTPGGGSVKRKRGFFHAAPNGDLYVDANGRLPSNNSNDAQTREVIYQTCRIRESVPPQTPVETSRTPSTNTNACLLEKRKMKASQRQCYAPKRAKPVAAFQNDRESPNNGDGTLFPEFNNLQSLLPPCTPVDQVALGRRQLMASPSNAARAGHVPARPSTGVVPRTPGTRATTSENMLLDELDNVTQGHDCGGQKNIDNNKQAKVDAESQHDKPEETPGKQRKGVHGKGEKKNIQGVHFPAQTPKNQIIEESGNHQADPEKRNDDTEQDAPKEPQLQPSHDAQAPTNNTNIDRTATTELAGLHCNRNDTDVPVLRPRKTSKYFDPTSSPGKRVAGRPPGPKRDSSTISNGSQIQKPTRARGKYSRKRGYYNERFNKELKA